MKKKFISDEEMATLEKSSPKKGFISDNEMAALESQQPSKLESAAGGLTQGLSLNFGDEISAGLGTAKDVLLTDKTLGDAGALYDEKVKAERQRLEELQKANPLSYGAGNVAGGVATAAVAPIGAGMSLAKAGATAGAVAGFGHGEGLQDSLVQGGLGAATGAAAGKVMEVGGKLIKSGANKITSSVKSLASKFLDPEEARLAALGVNTGKELAKDGIGSARNAVKIAQKNGVFDGADDIELVRDRLEDLLDTGKSQVDELINHAASRSVKATDVNLSGAEEVLARLERNNIDSATDKAIKDIRSLMTNVQEKAAGGDLRGLQELKRAVQQRSRELGAYAKTGGGLKDVPEAYSSIASSLKESIESAVDSITEPGALKAANEMESAALKLLPSVEKRIAVDSQKALNPLSKLQSLLDVPKMLLPNPLGASSNGLLQRANLSEKVLLPRSVDGIIAQKEVILQKVGQMAPEALPQIEAIFSLPRAAMAAQITPIVAMFKNEFEPAPYDSLLDGKIVGIEDQENHRKYIQDTVKSPVQKAKLLSALNKDGTYIPMPGLNPAAPTQPFVAPSNVAPRTTLSGMAAKIKEREY